MNVRKRGLALLMCICMVFTLLPFSALADGGTGGTTGEDPAVAWIGTTGYATLAEAINGASDGDTIRLKEGYYATYTTQNQPNYSGKNLTFEGIGEKTVWQVGKTQPDPDKLGTEYNGDYSFDGRGTEMLETVTFKNINFYVGTADYLGFIGIDNLVLENCIVNGKITYGGTKTATYKNVVFNAPTKDYSFFSIDGDVVNFDNCTFNGDGKFINVYSHSEASNVTNTINFNNCTVNSTAKNKQPLNIKNGDSTRDTGKTVNWIINISGNNVFSDETTEANRPVNETTCSRWFSVQDYNTELVTVNIDGTTVWKDGKMVSHNMDTADGSKLYTDGYKDNAFETKIEKLSDRTVTTRTCKYCGWTEESTVYNWNIPLSKTATEFDKDYKTDVTLSVPGVEKNLNSDVVFVLDTSDCVGSVMDQVKTLVEKLNTLSSEKKVNIKVGVVAFKGSAAAMFDGELVSVDKAVEDLNIMIADVAAANTKDEKEAAVVKYLNDNEDFIKKGSNLHSGLLAAQKLLDGDKEVDNDRKYLITVTDGLTYYWNDDQGNVYGIYCGTASENAWGAELVFNQWGPTFGVDTNSGTWKISSDSPINNWDTYIEGVRARIAADEDQYTANVRKAMTKLNLDASGVRMIPRDKMGDFTTAGYIYIPNDELKNHAHGIERSIVACIDTYKQLVTSDYNCYVVNTRTDEFPALVTSELNKLAGHSGQIDFNTIENKILYAVGAGSYVVDKIGDDFTLDENTLRVKVGEDQYLDSIKLNADEEGNWVQYFGDAATQLSEDSYRFKVEYNAADKTLTWTFNENVSNFAPVQLTYTLKLTKPETKPGTYGQLDLNGDGTIDKTTTAVDPGKALYTNESAVLNPIASNCDKGLPVKFPMPSLAYTVEKPYIPPVDPGIRDKITVEITGNSDRVVYDGTEHSVKDYTVKISDSRYTEKDFTFSGKALASGVNAGTYEMGLKADQFKNTNARFKNVEFIIKADGVLTITQRPLTITAGSAEGIAPVTCDKYTVEGLATGDKVDSVKLTGIQSEPGESPNVASDAVIKNAKGEDVTANYKITYVDGVLKAIEVLNKEIHFNYVIGYTDGTIRPNNDISRAEVATIFFRLLTDEARTQYDKTTSSFSDIKDGAWCCRAVSTLTNMGIIKGYTDGTFRPNADITRAELATIIARFAKLDVNTETFSDITGHWAQKSIELAAGNGWINGYTDGTFRPNKSIIRAETFAMINRVLDRQTESVSDLLPTSNMNMWSDNMNENAWYYKDVQEATNYHKCDRVGDSVYEKWTEKVPDIDWASYQI